MHIQLSNCAAAKRVQTFIDQGIRYPGTASYVFQLKSKYENSHPSSRIPPIYAYTTKTEPKLHCGEITQAISKCKASLTI